MHERPSTGRLEAVQAARAIAAMLVVAVHAIDLAKFRHIRHGDPLGALSGGRFYSDFGASGVDFFFVISGFVMAMVLVQPARRDAGSFFADRFVRILPLYWLMSALCIAQAFWLHRVITVTNIAMSVSLWPIFDPDTFALPVLFVGWTLAFEFAFYVTLLPWLGVPPERRLASAALSTGLIASAGYALAPSMDLVALFLNPIWFEFLAGIALFALWRRGLPRSVGLSLGLLGFIALAAGFAAHVIPDVRHFAIFDEGAGAARAFFWGVPYAMLLAGMLSFKPMNNLLWRALCRIGDASYSLYLVHAMLFLVIEYRVPRGVLPPDLITSLGFAGAILLGLATHRLVEQPLLAMLRRQRGKSVGERASPPLQPTG